MTNNKTPEDQRSGGHEVISVVFMGPGNMSKNPGRKREGILVHNNSGVTLTITPFGNTLATRDNNCPDMTGL